MNENLSACNEMSGPLIKCGYCGSIMDFTYETLNALPETHDCFIDFDDSKHGMKVNDKMVVTMVNLSDPEVPLPLSNVDLDDSIIYEVKKRSPLYDVRNFHVKDRSNLKLQALWEEISCCLEGVLTAKEVESRWQSLRRRYLEARKQEKQYLPSGSAANGKKKRVFPFMQQMEFLNDTQIFDKTECSLEASSVGAHLEEVDDARSIEDSENEEDQRVTEFQETAKDIMQTIHKKPDLVDGFVIIVNNKIKELQSMCN